MTTDKDEMNTVTDEELERLLQETFEKHLIAKNVQDYATLIVFIHNALKSLQDD